MSVNLIEAVDSWTPQVIFKRPLTDFVLNGLRYYEGSDGLDTFQGVFGWIGSQPIAIKVHPGNPLIDGSTHRYVSAYLPMEITDINAISAYVDFLVKEFSLTDEDIWWERSHGIEEEKISL